jgi:copper chaperone CopZ
MSCASCVSKIEKNVKNNLKGILSISINLLLKRGDIEYNSNLLNEDEIINYLNDMGFFFF